MKRILRIMLLTLNCGAAVWAVLIFLSGKTSWNIHLSMIALFSITAFYLSPYSKHLLDKPRPFEKLALASLWLLTFAAWLFGAFGVDGASVDRFFALIYLTMSVGGLVFLRHLPRLQSWTAS